MRSSLLLGWVLLVLAGALALTTTARAGDSAEKEFLHDVARPGMIMLMTAAVITPLVSEQGHDTALRNADAMASAALVTMGLKQLISSPRPDGTDNDSFPSNHTTVAFAAATMAADQNPEQAPYWYGAASLVAYSRVRLKRHRFRDVLAGAIIGFGIARLEQELPRGLILSPFIDPGNECTGVEVTWEF